MPLIALAAGLGIERLFIHAKNPVGTYFSRIKLTHLAVVLLLALVMVSPWVSKKISATYAQDKRAMFDTELSILVSNYFDEHPSGEIFTNLPILYFLPATKDRIWSPFGGYSPNVNDFDRYFENDAKPEVVYILAAPYTDAAVAGDIQAKIASKRYSLVFRHNGYILVETNNK
jgi:hypothetical protein